MNFWYSLLIAAVLFVIALFGVQLPLVFGVIIPYTALLIFVAGIVFRVVNWARSPVPFRWPTTAGQQRSLPWIKASKLESPFTIWGVLGRMALEVLFFRSLFRNTKTELREGPQLTYGSNKFLWLGALAFHWSFLFIVLRHFRFFTEPVAGFVLWLQTVDGILDLGLPVLYVTNVIIVLAVSYLLIRRLVNSQVRYISLAADYFPLFILLIIIGTGIWMRYVDKVDLILVKELTLGLASLHPVVPQGIGAIFFIHIFFVSLLLAYFPFSKLLHMAGVFFSPTRNLANNNRAKRHINPWNPDVKVHTYQEWEDEFRDLIKNVGLPLEKE